MLNRLPHRFAIASMDHLDLPQVSLYEIERMSYNYQDIYRIYNHALDTFRSRARAVLIERSNRYDDQMTHFGSMTIQLSSNTNTEIYFCVTNFEVEIEPGAYGNHNRNHNHSHNRSNSYDYDIPFHQPRDIYERIPIVIVVASNHREFVYQNTRIPECVVELEGHTRFVENFFQVMRRHREELFDEFRILRRFSARWPPMSFPNQYIGNLGHVGAGAIAAGTPERRRRDLTPPPAPRPRAVIVQPRSPNPVIIREAAQPQVPAERLALAVARDYIAQGEMCPILQEPLRYGPVALTSCHHVFDGDSLTSWVVSGHSTCPECRTAMVYRVVTVEAPVTTTTATTTATTLANPDPTKANEFTGQPAQVPV